MTLRRIVAASTVAGALSLGALAVPATAGAAPAAPASFAPSSTAIGRDPLAGFADAALSSWLQYVKTGKSRALAEFATVRDAVAMETGRRLGIDGTLLRDAWRRADQPHQVALMSAMSQLGTPYKRNTSKPGVGFDCSGLTTFAWSKSGVTLPRQSKSQINTVARVTRETAQAGDLVYYPGHVSMWLGVDNFIVHAPYTGRTVEVSHIRSGRSVLFGNPVG